MSNSWNFMDPASKQTLLGLVRREAEGMFALVDTDDKWAAPTACAGWDARDIIGHLVDTTETYFTSFDAAQGKGDAPDLVALTEMAAHVDQGAKSHRNLPRAELIARCRRSLDKMEQTFAALGDADWGKLMVPHKYMGPLPAFFYPIFQLVDYAVHSWDIREGAGRPHALAADTADMLVPLNYVLWSATAAVTPQTKPIKLGINVTSGENAGTTRISVSPEGLTAEPGPVEDLPAVIEFDPASFVLTAFGRINAGTVRGDTALANEFLAGFFRI